MSNLMPEKRVDKNGRLVTKHILVDRATAVPNRPIPAPAATKAQHSKASYSQRIADIVVSDEEKKENIADLLANELQRKTLQHVLSWASTLDSNSSGKLQKRVFANALVNLINSSRRNADKRLDRLAVFLVEVTPTVSLFDPDMSLRSAGYVTEIVRAVSYGAKVNGFATNEYSLTDEDRSIAQYTAFEYMVQKVNYARTLDWLQDESQWFADHAEKLSLHGSALIRRGKIDRDYLNELLREGTSTSLSSGVL